MCHGKPQNVPQHGTKILLDLIMTKNTATATVTVVQERLQQHQEQHQVQQLQKRVQHTIPCCCDPSDLCGTFVHCYKNCINIV
jgi:hypothetical protein